MDNYSFTRWKKFGHDRLYIADASGTKHGHIDLVTGEYALTNSGVRAQIEPAATSWCTANEISLPASDAVPQPPAPPVASPRDGVETHQLPTPPSPSAPSPPTPAVAPVTVERDWVDLAHNRPGEGVRMLAEQEWTAARERSKVVSFANRYLFDSKTNERAWRKGAEGEEYVGTRLNKLREKGLYVLHSVPVGKGDSDIDHIVIGPGGVFTVNSKKHDGKKIWVAKYQMRVNGQPVPYLRNSRHEAARAKKLLEARLDFDVPVMGTVVVLTGTIVPEVTYRDKPDDVRVLDKWDVPRWYRKHRAVLTPAQVKEVFEVARRSDTWRQK